MGGMHIPNIYCIIVLCEFGNSQLQVELCPVTNQVAFYSAHVRLNGNRLDLKNVRYLQESGVYQCVAENRHGMIVSYTGVNVRGKHLENCIYTIEPSFPYYKSGLFLCFKMNCHFYCENFINNSILFWSTPCIQS